MPSWDNASSRKILDHDHDVELDRLNPADEQKAPMLAHQAPSPRVDQGLYAGAGAVGGMAYQQHGSHSGSGYGDNYGQGYQDAYRSPGSGQALGPYAASVGSNQYGGAAITNPYGGAPAPRQHSVSPISPQPLGYGPPAALAAGTRSPPLSHNNSFGSQQQPAYERSSPYTQQPTYSAYAPSEAGTRYEPTNHYMGQESGTAYNVSQQQTPQSFHAAGAAAPSRRPVQNTWGDV